jgi:hypothetical protein
MMLHLSPYFGTSVQRSDMYMKKMVTEECIAVCVT